MKNFTRRKTVQIFCAVVVLVGCLANKNAKAQCIYFKKIATGATSIHCLGIATDGTLWGWGSNQFGQVGNNSFVNATEPVQISADTGWKEIATAESHSLAIDANGKLWGWGRDDYGQLGDGAPLGVDRSVLTPVRIFSADSIWKMVAAGSKHSMGITADGRLWVWGYDSFYDAGGTIPNMPAQVGSDTDWAIITTGNLHFIAIKKDSTLWAWGRNGEGEAGDSTTTANDYTPPVEIDSNHLWIAIAAGDDHTLALQKDSSLWTWGSNTYGQLGNGTTTDDARGPKQIGTAKYIAIGAGTGFSVAVSKDSLRWVWGINSIGQYGNDTGGSNGLHNSLLPELSDSSKHWVKVYGDANISLNLADDGSAWASGDNGSGELGDGNLIRSNVLIKAGTPSPYPALAASGSSDTEYQRGYSYYAANCSNLITEVFKTGSNPIHNTTTAKVWIDGAVNTDNTGKPYVQRHYEINPVSGDTTATGTVTLYFTQDEFMAYNTSANVINGTYPKLPMDATDAQGYGGNLRINKIMGSSIDGSGNLNTYQGSATLLLPTSVTYADGRWQATFDATGFGGFFATTGTTLLPLTWLNVQAFPDVAGKAELVWKVQEQNIRQYSVERSHDGISFSSLATVSSHGDGVNTYRFTDAQPGSTAFYRILQWGNDGKMAYSPVVQISTAASPRLSLFPNPANSQVSIAGLAAGTSYHAFITNAAGRVVLAKDITGTVATLTIATLAKGAYMLRLISDKTTATLPFIKE